MGTPHKQCLLFFHKVSPSKSLEDTSYILYIWHLKLLYMIVIQIRCYGNWSRVCMLTDARGSQNRFLLRMANKEMFDFVCRKIKIQADTFYRTRRRGLHQSQPVTVNEQNGKRPHKPKVPVFSTYVCIIIIWIQLFIIWFDDTVESRFFEPPRETKIGSKNRSFEKSGVKSLCLTEERKTTFGSRWSEVRKNDG